MHYADIVATHREKTPEGMLRSKVIVTRAGMFPYDGGDLNVGTPGQTVMVERPVDSLKHPDTLASIRGAPVTLGHPPQGVNSDNWDKTVVGSIVGEPKLDSLGNVLADIIVGRQDAVTAVESGVAELSIGYDFNHEPASEESAADLKTTGPMIVNHVAIVTSGRAGPGVRILDEEDMDETKLANAMTVALKAHFGDSSPQQDKGFDAAAISSVVMEAIKPVIQATNDMSEKMKKEQEDKDKEKRMKEAKEKADELYRAGRLDGANCADAISKGLATGKLTNDQATALKDKGFKEIAATILKDTIPNAANADEGYLRGVLDTMFANVSTASPGPGIGRPADGAGAFTIPGASGRSNDAYNAFVDSFDWEKNRKVGDQGGAQQ